MTKSEKLLSKARNNPSGLSFSEFERLLSHNGWTFDHQKGSHRIWRSPGGTRLPVQCSSGGKAKGYQVRQFLKQHGKERKNGQI
ncbi:type II toxin-antitoxin system HicA family toxin [Desulfonema magnum]|uniref:Toxin-antitoxin system, toxin component, HicA domain-containing protein n=1 Tax=Desulfonema magnum TaxID=45655 RepID=A0A975BF72_9BACT|nr:type II toxin-antitoxin system HicA family toxin [Desulfonema magnum]QTA84168.1 Toxin-antitoxin system, toxin component, HicA domain-containing protein [Desulfonema magnum]